MSSEIFLTTSGYCKKEPTGVTNALSPRSRNVAEDEIGRVYPTSNTVFVPGEHAKFWALNFLNESFNGKNEHLSLDFR